MRIFKIGNTYETINKEGRNDKVFILNIGIVKNICKHMTNTCCGKSTGKNCSDDSTHPIGVYTDTFMVSCPIDDGDLWKECNPITTSELLKVTGKVKSEWAKTKLKDMIKERL
ncbi:unnamed protein product [marine sediment metagenome]|uniref:Uncharacterized protein n=1 Tax=marine sediment metagenome TaxID=412755 RepID=X0SZT3_9ZZZZ